MIEALGNIGDFIGGIGVVITLLYLAFQVRQNSRSVKAAAAQGVLGSLAQTLNSIGSSPQASRVFALGQLDPSKLTDEEVYQFIHLILGYFRIIEQAFYQNRLGGLDEDLWNGHVAQVSSFMQAPSVQRWWATRSALFHPDFRRFIDDLPRDNVTPGGADVVSAIKNETASAV
jgi:hypothetical protein